MDTYAVIDIGTLKVKLLIAKALQNGNLEKLYSSNTLTCFGCDMDKNGGNVLEENLKSTIKELVRCKKLLKKYEVDKYRVVSTHAMRRAKNKDQIISEIKKEVGFEVENITQDKEAKLFFRAVIDDLEKDGDYAVLDVGGGSVQILIGNSKKLKEIHNMQTGAQYLHDNFTSASEKESSYTTINDIEKMKEYIMEQLLPFKKKEGMPIVYGSTNIIDLVKEIKIPVVKRINSKVHPYQIYAKHLNEFIEKMLPLSYKEREALYNFQKGYMWGIDKAFLNVVTIAKYFNSPFIIPTNANVAQGLIHELINSSIVQI